MMRIIFALVFVLTASTAFARSGIPGNNPTLRPNPIPVCTSNLIPSLATEPSAAFALRCINHNVTRALRIVRVSDTAGLDVGFNGNELDTAAITTFCASTTCNISVWYDQTSHGRHVSCFGGAFSTCALVWTGGAFSTTIGGKPAMLMNSTYNNWLYLDPGSPDTAIMSTTSGGIFGVANAASGLSGNAGQGWFLVPALTAVVPNVLNSNNDGIFFVQGGGTFSPPSFITNRYLGVGGGGSDVTIPKSYTYGTDGIFGMRFNTADSTVNKTYLNGGTPATSATSFATAASADLYIGAIPSFPRPYVGKLTEIYIFPTEPSIADTNILGNDIGTRFSISWTNITL